MKVFVISLPDQHERREEVRAQLLPHRVDFEFFDAVRGSDDPASHFESTSNWQYRLNTRRNPLPNEVGCYASHLSLWKQCARRREPIVVMEDDFVAHESFSAAVGTVDELIDRFGFIRLEPFKREQRPTRSRRGAIKVSAASPFAIHYLADPPLCMTAYAIGPSAAAALVDASATLVGPVDKFMQRTWHHRVPLFALDPPPVSVSEHADASTIGSRRDKSRSPLLLLARFIYKAIGQAQRGRFNSRQLAQFGMTPGGVEQ